MYDSNLQISSKQRSNRKVYEHDFRLISDIELQFRKNGIERLGNNLTENIRNLKKNENSGFDVYDNGKNFFEGVSQSGSSGVRHNCGTQTDTKNTKIKAFDHEVYRNFEVEGKKNSGVGNLLCDTTFSNDCWIGNQDKSPGIGDIDRNGYQISGGNQYFKRPFIDSRTFSHNKCWDINGLKKNKPGYAYN